MSMTSMTQLVKRRPVAGHFGGLDGGLRKWWDHQQTAVTDLHIECCPKSVLSRMISVYCYFSSYKACKLWYHLERVRKERLKSSFYESNLKGFPVWQGLCLIFVFLTTWCGWFHSNRPQLPSSWGESPRWLVVVMVAWCWRHQGQACVVKVCAQRVQETEYCRQHTHMQQHWILKQCWATAWDRILRQYWMYSSTIRNKCIPLNTASTTILSELYLYLSSGICVFVMMINSAILKTASTRIHTCTWVQCTWALHYLHCSIQSYHYIWYIAPGSQVVWVFQKDASLKADLCTHTPVFWHALKQSI